MPHGHAFVLVSTCIYGWRKVHFTFPPACSGYASKLCAISFYPIQRISQWRKWPRKKSWVIMQRSVVYSWPFRVMWLVLYRKAEADGHWVDQPASIKMWFNKNISWYSYFWLLLFCKRGAALSFYEILKLTFSDDHYPTYLQHYSQSWRLLSNWRFQKCHWQEWPPET